jgi:hypothetical protein
MASLTVDTSNYQVDDEPELGCFCCGRFGLAIRCNRQKKKRNTRAPGGLVSAYPERQVAVKRHLRCRASWAPGHVNTSRQMSAVYPVDALINTSLKANSTRRRCSKQTDAYTTGNWASIDLQKPQRSTGVGHIR